MVGSVTRQRNKIEPWQNSGVVSLELDWAARNRGRAINVLTPYRTAKLTADQVAFQAMDSTNASPYIRQSGFVILCEY